MIDLKSLARARRWRTGLDESADVPGQSPEDRAWLVIVPCRHGHIFIHSETELAGTTSGLRIARQLCALPGVRVHQRGDREATVVFDPANLDRVAELLQPRLRRVMTPLQRLANAARLAVARERSPIGRHSGREDDAPCDAETSG